MKCLFCALILVTSVTSAACMLDGQCGLGGKCVKPAGSYGQGLCVQATDQLGNVDYLPTTNIQPANVVGCMFDIDCGIGFACVKRSGAAYGICVKD